MTHYIICPYSKPEYLDNLLACIKRQTYTDITPIIVENGSAVGTFPRSERAVIITSGAHQSLAKNAALAYIREHGDGSWSVFDCDDYYGPDYIKTQLEALEGHDISGKSFGNMMYLKYDDGIYLSQMGLLEQDRSLTGGAMTCRTAKVLDFPMISVGEDGSWIWHMLKKGVTIAHTGPMHYCYNRAGEGHTWHVDKKTEKVMKGRMKFLGEVSEEVCNQPPRKALNLSETVARVLMLYTPDYLPAKVSVPDMTKYCKIWDYDLQVYSDKIVQEWPAAWSKILATVRALEEVPPNEWVMWIDADMTLKKHKVHLESMIDSSKDFMISVDHNGICTGLFMIRNTPLMWQFFTDLLKDIRMEWPWEQNAMKDLLAKKPEYAERMGLIPESVVQNPSSGRMPGAFVMHYWGNAYPDRAALLQKMSRDIFYRDSGRSRGRLFNS